MLLSNFCDIIYNILYLQHKVKKYNLNASVLLNFILNNPLSTVIRKDMQRINYNKNLNKFNNFISKKISLSQK